MAESTFTQTGVEELRNLAAQFPQRLDAICLRVADGTANAMIVEARRRLLAPSPPTKRPHIHKPGESMAEAVEKISDPDHKQVRVVSNAPSQYPANLTIWVEHGTSQQPARPYMRPAAEAARAQYERDFEAATTQLISEVFG